MPKKSFSNKSKSIKRRKSKSRKRTNLKRGGGNSTTMPMRYFNPDHYAHYYANPINQPNQVSVSHGIVRNGVAGPNLFPKIGLSTQTGGAPLPAEYFGGNSGRYFAEGSPELQHCTTAYGHAVPTSHGVVMMDHNADFMGPNLAPYPNHSGLTGGGRKTRKRKSKRNKSKKSKKRSVKKNKKSRK
jgi:hypothetical protein